MRMHNYLIQFWWGFLEIFKFIWRLFMYSLFQMLLHSCAEPNSWIKYGKRVVSESIWLGSFSLVWQKRLVWQKFDRVCRTFVELNLGLTHGVPSESDVAPVLLENQTYSVRFGTLKVRRLNQDLAVFPFWQFWNQTPFHFKNTYFVYFLGLFLFWKFKLLCFQPTLFTVLRSFV